MTPEDRLAEIEKLASFGLEIEDDALRRLIRLIRTERETREAPKAKRATSKKTTRRQAAAQAEADFDAFLAATTGGAGGPTTEED